MAQIHDAHVRHRGDAMAALEFEMAVAPAGGVDETFQGRRGAGQYHGAIFRPRPHHRHVAGVIDGAILLLEGLFVFLVDNHQPQRRKGQEQGRTRAHHHLRFAPHHRAIGPAAFLLRQVAVPFRGPHAKTRREAFQKLDRQRDLRQQDQNLPVLAQGFGNRLEIDFGLARSGHAIQQMRRECVRGDGVAQHIGGARLIGIQFRRGEIRFGFAEGGKFRQLGGLERARLDQPAHHGGRNIGVFRQAGHAAGQPVLRDGQRPLARLRQAGGYGVSFYIGDAAGLRLEGTARAQRHRQNRAGRIEGIGRDPVDEIAQSRGQAWATFQRLGHLEAVVANRAFGRAPHHPQHFAIAQGGGNQGATGCVYPPRQLVVVRPRQRQRQQDARAFHRRQHGRFGPETRPVQDVRLMG